MTDSEIVKALECCLIKDCDNCPFDQFKCEPGLEKESLALINRQKAEIERLQKIIDCYEETSGNKKAKTEVAREILADIEKLMAYRRCGNGLLDDYLEDDLAELKNKYIKDGAE